MSAPIAPILEHWREFYLLVGTAAAALIALLFVAVSIGAGFLSPERSTATRTFMSPVVVHFTSVLFAAAVGLVPSHTRASFGLLIGAGAVAGAIYSATISMRLLRGSDVVFVDRLAYGLAAVISYAAALVAVGLFFAGSRWAPDVLAGAVLVLLIVNIRNAWDLTLFMAHRHTEAK